MKFEPFLHSLMKGDKVIEVIETLSNFFLFWCCRYHDFCFENIVIVQSFNCTALNSRPSDYFIKML